jgi:polyisoprenoid-binding protein YceI
METLKSIQNLAARYMSQLIALVIVFNLNVLTTNAQAQGQYKVLAGSQIKVDGTSNLHDWSMVAGAFTVDATIAEQLKDVTNLSFTLPVKNLKSKEKLMDTRAYKSLKAEDHDKITFKLTSATVVPQQKIIKSVGSLTIAGVTREVPVQVNYVENADGIITITGSKKFKMSEFKIDPPSFMMGALKVGDEITVNMNLKLKK